MRTMPPFLIVDGHEVTLSFAEETSPALLQIVKQALFSAYINDGITQKAPHSLAGTPYEGYNTEGGNTNEP